MSIMNDGKPKLAIDIGTELAEGFALPPGGLPIDFLAGLVHPKERRQFHQRHLLDRFDDEVLPIISSAHLACGLHSGDPLVIHRTVAKLVERNVQIGAHPSYPDVFNFGQDRVAMSGEELVSVLLYQFGALQGLLSHFDQCVRHVKCHGALAFDVAYEDWACAAMVRAIKLFDPSMVLVAMAGTNSVAQARTAGIRVVEEGFADRGYDSEGHLVPRSHPKALFENPEDAACQVIAMAREGVITTVDGDQIPLRAQTFCLHSDTPSAGEFARAIIRALEIEEIGVTPLSGLAW